MIIQEINKKIKLSIGVWGFKKDNLTALHLLDIMNNNEDNLTIHKINNLLLKYYEKLFNLIGSGQYQHYYMELVRKDTLNKLNNITFNVNKTKDHINSLISIVFRGLRNMDYIENLKRPKF